jgi:hypothetical protein
MIFIFLIIVSIIILMLNEILFIDLFLHFLVDDFNESSSKKNSTSKIKSIFKGNLIYITIYFEMIK